MSRLKQMGAALAVATAAAGLGVAPGAQATIRFADPNGAGMTSNCTSPDPNDPTDPACTLQRAVEVVAQDGDEVIVNSGDYNEGTDQVTISDAISVRGADGQPVPTISSDALGAGVFVGNLASSLRRLRIEYTTPHVGLLVKGTAEQVVVDATDSACELQDGAVIRDSVCWTHGATNERGLGMTMLSPTTVTATVRNVTAVGTGTGVSGIGVSGLSGGNVTIDAQNVIARGTLADVTAFASGAASTATVNLSHSNYATELETPVSGGVPSVTNPGSPTNQTAAPMFADATVGDFHQLPGSSTIDAGNASASMLGTLDIDGEPRIMGPAPDIGADELPDISPPDTTITKRPRNRTTRRRATFKFTSSEPGSTFECKLDRKPYKTCASPKRYARLKPRRHVFRVRAKDAADNVDATPATDSWRVKKN